MPLVRRVAFVLVASLICAAVVHEIVPSWPFLRILSRVAGIFALLVVYLHVRAGAPVGLQDSRRWRMTGYGIALGIFAGVFFVGMKFVAGAAAWRHVPDIPGWKLAGAAAAGITVGFLEEIFFRGYLAGELSRKMSRRNAIVISSAFFATVHFIRPLPDPFSMFVKWMGLFLIGMLLARIFFETGSIYFSAGLHASLVFFEKASRIFIEHRLVEPHWLWGTDRMAESIASWPVLIGLIFLAGYIGLRCSHGNSGSHTDSV